MKKNLLFMLNATILLIHFVKIPFVLAENQESVIVNNHTQMSVGFKLKNEKNFEKLSKAEEELGILREDLINLRKQLLEMLEISNKQKKDYENLQRSIAINLKNSNIDVNDKKNIESLQAFLNSSKKFIEKSYDSFDSIDLLLQQKNISLNSKKNILLDVKKMKKEAIKFYASEFKVYAKENIRSCFIISIEKNLGIIIVSAGSLNAIKVGDIWESADKRTVFKTICLRDNVSGIIVTQGNLGDLIEGNKIFLKTNHKLNNNKIAK